MLKNGVSGVAERLRHLHESMLFEHSLSLHNLGKQ